MEQFSALPFPQRVAVLVGGLVLLGALFYYTIIIPVEEARAAAIGEKTSAKNAISKIKTEVGSKTVDVLSKEKVELEAELKRFQEMLPKREELEAFIIGISETARSAGLELLSFTKGKHWHHDHYFEVPITMNVRGSFRELIGFMRTISERDRRIINIRDMTIERELLPVGDIISSFEQRRREELPEGAEVKKLDPAAALMQRVRAYEEAIHRGVKLSAEFTAYVFSYTGKLADTDSATKNKATQLRLYKARKKLLTR